MDRIYLGVKIEMNNEMMVKRKPKSGESLTEKCPELAVEWHPTKNGVLTPANVAFKPHMKVWWKCKYCGFEWESVVSSRANGAGCPSCAKLKIKR